MTKYITLKEACEIARRITRETDAMIQAEYQRLYEPEPSGVVAVPPEPQLWICPKAGECTHCDGHNTPHKFNEIECISIYRCNKYGDSCPACIPYVEPVSAPAENKQDERRPCFDLYDEKNNWKIETCCYGQPGADSICNHIRNGGSYNDCKSGALSSFRGIVNALADMVDETETIQELTQKLIAIGESIPPEDLARLHANKVDKRIAELEADCEQYRLSARKANSDANQLRVELSAFRNPQRDTRTRVEDGLPTPHETVQTWTNRGEVYAYHDGGNGGTWRHHGTNDPLYMDCIVVAYWRKVNWSPFSPVPEPTYTVAEHGMPKEEGHYWIKRSDIRVWCIDYWNTYKNGGGYWGLCKPEKVERYQRIHRPPETQEKEK